MDDCDVLVVGAGLAGLSTARGLARRGLAVTLIDRKRDVGAGIATTGIFVRRTLDDFALPAAHLGPAIRDVALYSPAGRSLALHSPRDEFRVGRMAPLLRDALAAAEAAGVRFAAGARLVGLEPQGGGLTAVIERRPGRRHRVRTGFVVGADGARSRVARGLGLAVNREHLVGVEEIYADVPLAGPPIMHCHLDPALAPGYLAWLVHDGEEVHVGVAGYADRFAPRAALAVLVARLTGRHRLDRGRLVERRGGLIPVGGLLPRIAAPRGLLVGDAAGAVSPLTAGGLDPCLRQAELAVEVTATWLGQGRAAALAAYQSDALRARFRGRRLMRLGLAQLERRALVEVGVRLLATPPLSRFASQVFFGRGSFPDLDLGRAMAAIEAASAEPRAVGAIGPAGVLRPSG